METGHAKQVATFEEMVSFVVGYGGVYKPSLAKINLANLQAALALGQAVIDGVTTGLIGWKGKVNFRENQYNGVGKLATKVVAAYEACGATANAVEDMQGFARKIAGGRKKKLVIDDPNTPENEAAHNSVSQRSYTNVAEHFDNMIEMCLNEPLYSPNESDVQIATLQAKFAAMKAANTGVIDSVTAWSNNRISRNSALYDDETSIYELSKLVKKYVKSIFGADSPQFKQVSGLKFKKR